ncbi:hypothetical protein KAR48_20290 [bacterium]|nr:hypothetical protein [bacterium]
MEATFVLYGVELENLFLRRLLQRFCSAHPTDAEVRQLVEMSAQLALRYLKYKQSRGFVIAESRAYHAEELKSLAIDLIAELFERNDFGEFIIIRNYFTPHLSESSTEIELSIYLRRLITNHIEQRLTRIYKERDPEAAKIIKNIKIAVANNLNLSMVHHGNVNYVTPNDLPDISQVAQINDDGMGQGLINNVAISLFRPVDTIPVMLKKLFTLLKQEPALPNCLALNVLMRIIRDYRKHIDYSSALANRISIDNDPERLVFHQEMVGQIKRIQKELFRKVDVSYRDKGKLSEEDTEALKSALALMTKDLVNGDTLDTHYFYIHEMMPAVSMDEYNLKYRKQFEYFVRILRNEIKETVFANSGQ